jgi:hypothetical protein
MLNYWLLPCQQRFGFAFASALFFKENQTLLGKYSIVAFTFVTAELEYQMVSLTFLAFAVNFTLIKEVLLEQFFVQHRDLLNFRNLDLH